MNHRITREIQRICSNPPFGISCNFKDDSLNNLEACIAGVSGTPYEKGVFKLLLNITDKYPFEPPQIKFITPVYHPNVDNAGRICLDLLKMPPKGAWKPTATIEGLLTAIQSLLENPNPDDPLVPDIAEEFKYNKMAFETKARSFTEQYALQNKVLVLTDIGNQPKNDANNKSENKKSAATKRKTPPNSDEDLGKEVKRQ